VRPILIFKTGSAPAEIVAQRGDFEQWIEAGLQAAPLDVVTLDVSSGASLPDHDLPSGVVVTGSASMVSDREPWSEAAAGWLVEAVRRGTPVFGICYGHQLLAHGLGGLVGRNPNGREIGTVSIQLSDAAATDPLLGGTPRAIRAQETHRESVLALPPGAVRLAANDADGHQAVRFAERAWGVQFHPEFDAEVSRAYLSIRRGELLDEELDPDALLAAAGESPEAARLLARFAEIVREVEGLGR